MNMNECKKCKHRLKVVNGGPGYCEAYKVTVEAVKIKCEKFEKKGRKN